MGEAGTAGTGCLTLSVDRDIHELPISFNLKYQRGARTRLSQAFTKLRGIVDVVAVDLMDDVSGFEFTIAR